MLVCVCCVCAIVFVCVCARARECVCVCVCVRARMCVCLCSLGKCPRLMAIIPPPLPTPQAGLTPLGSGTSLSRFELENAGLQNELDPSVLSMKIRVSRTARTRLTGALAGC